MYVACKKVNFSQYTTTFEWLSIEKDALCSYDIYQQGIIELIDLVDVQMFKRKFMAFLYIIILYEEIPMNTIEITLY